MKGLNIWAIVVTLLLLSICATATVAENCRIKNQIKCANGSTIAMTVVMSLLIAATSYFWVRPVYFPTGLTIAASR